LREARLRHRRDRLQLVIFALDERLGSLSTSDRTRHLVAAISGFQQELASVRAELRTLHSSTEPHTPLDESRGWP
jgi:capsule polysaccharide export protein KpsE/RkpR